ncbi:guanine nucleotide exchange protein smcr8a [Denticeps clupeoides]|uniref:UDENN FLCN/SMCR8-type domain-containing protein n=1 Tax=Denticeps clupeoides TaxID=299321 RepID=A0AAY4BNP4_9TELE|nr:guanine nucleotide exchange protein SMCR8 [Denticeps clupeoides]
MIGSPDVVALTKEDDFGEVYPDPSVLPEDFSVPLFAHAANANPWTKTSYAKFSKDFILISEFSEQVGPQPLLTIPEDPKVCGTFDLNYFSLRIMSVDYQASFVGHPPGSSYPKLNFVEDSKVVLGDSKEGAFAYVHHLTLYDLEARGFVRPFCMAYISADERKIMQQFQELSSKFSRASECLKSGNRKAFANELQKKLKDLEYTRSVVHKETELQKMNNGCYSTQAIEKANELANVEKSIYEHKDLLRQITSYPNRKRQDVECLQPESEAPAKATGSDVAFPFNHSDAEHNPADGDVSDPRPSYTPQLIKAKSAKCFDKRLKTLEELCELASFHQTMDQLKSIEKSFRGDLCYIYTSQIDQILLGKQKITNFLFESDWGNGEPAKHFEVAGLIPHLDLPQAPDGSGEPTSLETCTSFGDSVHIKLELESVDGPAESSPSDLTQETSEDAADIETKGSFSSDKSIETLGAVSPSNLHSHLDVMGRRGTSDECSGTENGIFFDRSTVSSANAPYEKSSAQPGAFSLLDNDSTVDVYHTETLVKVDTACCMGQEGFIFEEPEPVHQRCGETVVKQEPLSLLYGDLALQVDFAGGEAAHEHSPSAVLSFPNTLSEDVARMNVEESSDTTSYMSISTSSDRAPSPLGHGNPVTVKQKKKAGQSALKFIRQYPFAQQAIFCLLSGRTLVVLGVDEGTVRKLVNALSIFVPNLGRYAEQVQPWLCCPFQLTDLQRWKLIGLQRIASPTGSSMLYSLSRYSRYIGILDADNKTLRCPTYKGTLIGHIADHRTQIKRGSTYYHHVQNMLTQLTAKAFLYTFCHHLHLPLGLEDEDAVVQRRTTFLYHLGFSEEESKIVHYLSGLIKQRYVQGPCQRGIQPVFAFNYTTSCLYKI